MPTNANPETVRFLLDDWRDRLTDAHYQTQDALTHSFTVIEAVKTVDPNNPDFTELQFGLDQLTEQENQGGWDEGTPPGNEPVGELVREIRENIELLEAGEQPNV